MVTEYETTYAIYGFGEADAIYRITEMNQSSETVENTMISLDRWVSRHPRGMFRSFDAVSGDEPLPGSVPLPVLFPSQRWALLKHLGLDLVYTLKLVNEDGFYRFSGLDAESFSLGALTRYYWDLGKIKRRYDGWSVSDLIVGVP